MENEPEVFDKEYVSKVRAEAAQWRTKARELESQVAQMSRLEAQITAVRVENELVKRGIAADPSWVTVEEGQDIGTAVDSFVERWPHLAQSSSQKVEEPTVEETSSRKMPPAMPPNPNKANVPGPKARGYFGDRTMEEIKKDPVAKSQLTDIYRDLIRQNSHQSSGE